MKHRPFSIISRLTCNLQLKTDVVEGRLRCNHEQAIVLASYSLQVETKPRVCFSSNPSVIICIKYILPGWVWWPRSREAHGRVSERLSTSSEASRGSVWGPLRPLIYIFEWCIGRTNNLYTGPTWCPDRPSSCPPCQFSRSASKYNDDLFNRCIIDLILSQESPNSLQKSTT